ncbi:Protein of unknown function [Polaromonas sp. OV174]|uniref:DUF1631 family protein n=1 Tax=Polaromonas sp. OV174 TaxID=1855300 RepID=UPI0008E1D469|nr:DUF1631 family protein [Polaromonas sp. OV174]SFC19580.1 Protein of unknown function [Polaromonas sp. OV174]
MASQPDILQSCLQEAAQAARPALERCIEDAVAALQLAETKSQKMAERDELATAWRELLKNKSTWSSQYPADLLLRFKIDVAAAEQAMRAPPPADQAQPPASASASNSAFAALSGHNLTLVDDADVSQAIESARLLQLLLPVLEHPLAELNKLMSAVQGLPNVRPELNPLRPEVFAQTLRERIFAASVAPAISSLWLKYLADPLGRELKRVYEQVVKQLERAHVQGASYRVLPTPASAARGQTSAFGPLGSDAHGDSSGAQASDETPAKPPSQYADLSNYDIQDELFQNFLFHGGSQAHHGLAPAYYASVDQELAELQAAADSEPAALADADDAAPPDYRSMAAVDRPQRLLEAHSPLSQQRWGTYAKPRERDLVRTQLKKEATQVGQVLGLEVVRKLVGQVAQDPRLLVPVREAIVALEPSLLRLAMVDPRFFSDEGHAGRRLMERVAQRSFKYNDEFSGEFSAFFEPVAQVFNGLNAQSVEDVQPFRLALAGLEESWDTQDQQEAQQRHKVLQSLRFAEERQTQADQIAFDLSTRSDLENVPGMVLDFLFGSWSLAMAHAKLTDTRGQIDPQGFGSVVPDLLWSVKQDVTLKQPAKLIEMIPSLLGKLHTGLDLLGQDQRENEVFFESLMNLHRPVLKLRRFKSQRDAQESDTAPLQASPDCASPEQRQAKAAEHPWLGRNELDAAGFEDTLPSMAGELSPYELEAISAPAALTHAMANTASLEPVQAAPAPAAPLPQLDPTMSQAEAEQLLLTLQAGRWVDLYSRRRWLRAQLIWASTKGTLFMFVSHGGQPHSMTKRSCERLLRERLLRPVQTHGVVAQALDQLVKETAPASTY